VQLARRAYQSASPEDVATAAGSSNPPFAAASRPKSTARRCCGIDVGDRTYTMTGVLNALRNVHHFGELKALVDTDIADRECGPPSSRAIYIFLISGLPRSSGEAKRTLKCASACTRTLGTRTPRSVANYVDRPDLPRIRRQTRSTKTRRASHPAAPCRLVPTKTATRCRCAIKNGLALCASEHVELYAHPIFTGARRASWSCLLGGFASICALCRASSCAGASRLSTASFSSAESQ
jgi:hypothetical protein